MHQLRALVTHYRVKGTHAAKVEHYLKRHTGMAALRSVCCGWEPGVPRGHPQLGRLPRGRGFPEPYEITMASDEMQLSQRSAWPHISSFTVSVRLYLESP